MADQADRKFEMEIEIAVPPDQVWHAIADAEGVRRWFAPVAEADREVGGKIVWEWAPQHRWVHRIEAREEGKRLKTSYDSSVPDGSGGQKKLFVEFLLEGQGGSTKLRVVQSGFGPEADFDEEYEGISRGWPVELGSLKLSLEKHPGKDRQIARAARDLVIDQHEAWRRLTGDQGFACGPDIGSLRKGEPFRFETADGDVIEGTALHCHDTDFCGCATSHGNAFVRISSERWGGQVHPWLWLAAYGEDEAELKALSGRWDKMLERLFADCGESAAGSAGTS